MHAETVLYQECDGLARITLHRPEARNALDLTLLEQLSKRLDQARDNSAIRAVIITGSGDRAFSAGADIAYLHQATPLEVREFARLAVHVNHQVETLGKLVVAAIRGFALGGGLELAEACMLRVASHDATLGHPEVRIGAVAGFGGTTRLPRLVGRGRAADLLLTGRLVGAEEALEIGLVQRVVEPEAVLAEAENVARTILENSPIAVSLTWEALHRGLDLSMEASAALGADMFGLVASTADFREGTRAFLSKARPSYAGR
ncbi:putative enoyl-CoA hydratase [compost metagenome]